MEEKNKNKKKVVVENEMLKITLEELQYNELDLDELCELFSDVALAFGYRFKDNHSIVYTEIDE